ncbi:MAG: transglycosylase SLT domain-containing protein [Bdellovibrionota bacterium]
MRGIKLTPLAIIGAIIFLVSSNTLASRDWDDTELGSKESLTFALKNIQNNKKQPAGDDKAQILLFTQGVLSYHQGKYDDAIANLLNSVKANNFLLEDYAHYFIGLSYSKQQKFSEAYKEFNLVSSSKQTSPRQYSALFRMGEIAVEQKNYRAADQHFRLLERKVRNTEKYPFVLWNLAKVNIQQKNIFQACKHVRKLYAKYPAHELTIEWGLDLKNATVDGLKPGCLASLNEQKQRIRNLQYAGDSERAKKEIRSLYEKTNDLTKYYVDVIYARFLTDDGDVDEALKILLPYHEERKGDIAYLMLLAKAAARKNDSALAISAYLKAHQMKPKSSVGREALFQAAFVSYLSQDYDGALARFDTYRKKYGGKNGAAASWYIAWVKYLKGDYKGAYVMLDQFSKQRFSRKMRNLAFDTARITYWKNICLLKMGQVAVARKALEKIAEDPSVSYYALAAKARLANLQPLDLSRKMASSDKKIQPVNLSPLSLISPTLLAGSPAIGSQTPSLETDEEILADVKEEGISESAEDGEETSETTEEKEEESDTVVEAPPEAPVEATEEGDNIFSTLKDPRLLAIFQRAETLRALGFDEWSNKELQFLEARTRNKTYLQTLIEKYEIGNTFSRSAYIAEVYYENERRKGLNASNPGWKKAFPQAYEKFVTKSAEQFGISESLIWGIMRTESFFRPQVKSSVGAMGLMQVMPLTASKMAEMMEMDAFKTSQLFDPDVNVRVGAKYLQRLSKMFDGHLPLVAAGYNAGPHRVHAWVKNFGNLPLDEFIEHIPYSQTRGYAKKVLRSYYVYGSVYYPEEIKKKSIQWLAQPANVTLNGPIPTKETWEPL